MVLLRITIIQLLEVMIETTRKIGILIVVIIVAVVIVVILITATTAIKVNS